MKNNIYKRGTMYWVRFNVDGRRKNISLKTSEHAQATIFAPKVIARYRSNSVMGVTGWLAFQAKYLEWSENRRNEQTIYRDEYAFKLFDALCPGLVVLSDMTLDKLEDFQTRLLAHGKTQVNTNRLVRSIKTAMRKAEEWKLCEPLNWNRVKPFKEKKGRVLWWTPEECRTLLDKCNGAWRTIAMLGLRAGLRRGEMYSLDWRNIDLKLRLIHVTHTADWTTKTKESRAVVIVPDLYAYLKPMARTHGSVLNDEISNLDVMTNYFKRLIKKANLQGSIHTCRHTYASHMVQNGANLSAVAKLLGHSTTKTTEIYEHLAPGNLVDATECLPSY